MLTESCFVLVSLSVARAGRPVAIIYFVLTLVFTGLYRFVPAHAPVLYRRTLYYLFGSEGGERAAGSVRRLVAGWVARNASSAAVVVREL